jgi:hypothetical protein
MVVYESLWGNTAAKARAIAEGIGPGTRVLFEGTEGITPEDRGKTDPRCM